MNQTRVLVADNHALVRQGIVTFVRDDDALQVVAEATNGREAQACADTQQRVIQWI